MMGKRKFNAENFLIEFGQYVSLVQSEVHVRRVRAAIWWSIISLIYVFGGLKVELGEKVIAWGMTVSGITNIKLLFSLFALNAWYTVRFFFSAAKICMAVKPRVLWKTIKEHKQYEKDNPEYKDRLHIGGGGHSLLRKWNVAKPTQDELFGKHSPKKSIENEDELRYYNVRHPFFGRVENFFFLLIVPAALSAGSVILFFCFKVWPLISEKIFPLTAS